MQGNKLYAWRATYTFLSPPLGAYVFLSELSAKPSSSSSPREKLSRGSQLQPRREKGGGRKKGDERYRKGGKGGRMDVPPFPPPLFPLL